MANTRVKLHFRTDLHLARKTWHFGMGLVIVLIYALSGMSRFEGVLILSSFLILDLLMETARLQNPSLNEKILKLWGPLMRQSETNRMSAIPHYLAASIIAIAIFPKPVAVLAILYLAAGDPVASLFGITYGHLAPRFKNGKSWIGTLAGILTCILVGFVALSSLQLPLLTLVPIAVMGGLAGGLAEHLPFDVDDNFLIPIFSGLVLWALFIIFV